MKDKTEIFGVITEVIKEVLPEVNDSMIKEEISLSDLGANSIDRGEIVMQTMVDLGVKTSLSEMAGLKSIGEIVNFYHEKLNSG